MSWGNRVVLEFLELYRQEQHLWDPKHPQHRNRTEVANAWLRIQGSLSLNVSVTDLKKKKESLMTSFRMHLNRKKNQESYQTNWFAFPLMESFLGEKYDGENTSQSESEIFTQPSFTHTPPTELVDTKKNINRQKSIYVSNDYKYRATSPTSEIRFAKKQMDEAVSCLKRAATEKKQDEYDLYGQLLAKKLRKLDERQRDVAMHEIDNIMFRAKMQSDGRPPRSYSSSPVSRKMNSPVFISIGQSNANQYEQSTIQYEEPTHPPV